MRFQCPLCSYTMRGITQSMLGRKVRCPDCDKTSRLPSEELAEGRVIGDFIIKRRLGAGSIGAVFFAHQISLDRAVALKVLSKEYSNSKGIETFLKEARAAAKLSHPNLVQSFGVGEEEGICFMAMNFIEGETVKAKIDREGKLKVDEALHIAQQVAEGLFYAWTEASLIHRDVKPENIMLTKEGAVKLTDLGLAMSETEWSEDMEISGSPSYMSPEQFTGEKLDPRSDIYSLGISLYQMISGQLPFKGDTLKTVAKQHFYEANKPLHKLDPMIPLKVSNLVQKMIAKEPENRFNDMEELIREIWEVRQITAPDKDLIPSVHTISIKKLDYELQAISEERKKHLAIEKKAEKEKNDILKRTFIIGLPVLLALLIFFIIMHIANRNADIAEALKVETFAELMENESIDSETIMKEWETTKFSLQSPPQNDFQKELHTRMDLYKAQIKLRELQKRLAELAPADSNAAAQPRKATLKALIKNNKEKTKELNRKAEELAKKEAVLNEKIKNFMKQKEKSEGKTSARENDAAKTVKGLKTVYEKYWKNSTRRKLLGLIAKQKFADAEALLSVEAEKHPSDKEWFENKQNEIAALKTLYDDLISSASAYEGTQLKEGTLRFISNIGIQYIDKNGDMKQKPWDKLDEESLFTLASKILPQSKESTIRAYVLLLTGKPAEAAEVNGSSEIQAICDAVCEETMDNIKRTYIIDKKSAKDMALKFLKDIAGTPERQNKYREELKQLFAKDK